jgi:dihydroorotate dehydrogenase (fumarate)
MSVDLRTRYLGLELGNPLVVAACPLSEQLDTLRRLEEAGAAAAVFPSLFEEQIEHDELEVHWLHEFGTDSFAESLTYLPELDTYNVGPDGYLRRLEEARKAVAIPIMGSLNGQSAGGWVRYARLIQDAGANGLELNIYFLPADDARSAHDVENQYLDLVAEVAAAISIPLAVKVPPFFSAFASMARRLVDCGARGLVLFNRFVHPDIDLEQLKVVPRLELSRSWDSRLSLTWIALLRGRVAASLAASGGVHDHEDVLKLLLAGADVTMIASALYQHGPDHLRQMLCSMRAWLEEHGYLSVEQLKGSMSQEHCPDPSAYERVNYMKTLASFTKRPRR